MPTVLITGCSSGFGLETAKLFLKKGWKVVATMREPRADILPTSNDLTILPLDVTDPASVASAVEQAGEFDVLVNNAGFGAAVPIELIRGTTRPTIVLGYAALLGRARLKKAAPLVPAQATDSVRADVNEIKERAHR